ncbi:MAG: S8 family serine peptidase [Isosphaeraceae bacterium]
MGSSIDGLIQAALNSGTTGRFLIALQPGEIKAAASNLKDKAGISTVSSADYEDGVVPPDDLDDESVLLADLGIVITSKNVDSTSFASVASEDGGVRTIVPETLVFASNFGEVFGASSPSAASPVIMQPQFPGMMPPLAGVLPAVLGGRPVEYWLGYLAALQQLLLGIPGATFAVPAVPSSSAAPTVPMGAQDFGGFGTMPGTLPEGPLQEVAAATQTETWGLRATRVISSRYTGAGVRVAVLDTGLDLAHPDFQDGRIAATASFVGQPVQDVPTRGNPGHGTHCIGTACGPKSPSGPSAQGRYGIAYESQIYVGKVLTNFGVSTQRQIPGVGTVGSVLEGIQWAIQQGCHICSMSLGSPPSPFGDVYRQAAEQATLRGMCMIAAAGNDSNRPGLPFFRPNVPPGVRPVSSPANNLRVMGVGAVDEQLRLAAFSNRGFFNTAAAVDLVGPGINVYSSVPGGYGLMSGTSQATPHVSGIAALLRQARPNDSPLDILRTLMRMAQALPGLDPNDVGAGLVQAPQ